MAARLVQALAADYPDCLHVGGEGLLAASDLAIWDHARERGLVLVTKDADFQRLSILLGFPPKVIWIRLGNCSTNAIAQLLRDRRDDIDAFLQHEEAGFLALA
jgi:predicted nuclease of predicted toxin-antitoxin system